MLTWSVWIIFAYFYETYFHFSFKDIQIEALLIRACEPVIQSHCHVSQIIQLLPNLKKIPSQTTHPPHFPV